MTLKEFLLDVLCRTVNASWYRTLGCSPEEASFLADMEANTASFKQSEKRNPSYALSELRCNLSEEDRNTERPETLENICAASGDVDAYIAEKAKTDARYSAVQKEFQRIDASKTALEERRRKLREENPWTYEKAEKFRQEAIQIREEAKNRDNDQSYSRGYALSLRPQFSPFTVGNGIIKEDMCDESEGFSDRAS